MTSPSARALVDACEAAGAAIADLRVGQGLEILAAAFADLEVQARNPGVREQLLFCMAATTHLMDAWRGLIEAVERHVVAQVEAAAKEEVH